MANDDIRLFETKLGEFRSVRLHVYDQDDSLRTIGVVVVAPVLERDSSPTVDAVADRGTATARKGSPSARQDSWLSWHLDKDEARTALTAPGSTPQSIAFSSGASKEENSFDARISAGAAPLFIHHNGHLSKPVTEAGDNAPPQGPVYSMALGDGAGSELRLAIDLNSRRMLRWFTNTPQPPAPLIILYKTAYLLRRDSPQWLWAHQSWYEWSPIDEHANR